MRSTRTRLFAALAAPLLVVALAGCGGDTKGSDSSSAAAEDSSSPAASDLQAGDEVDPADFLATMKSGMESATTATLAMKMSLSGMEITADGAVDYTTTPPSMAMKMTIPMLGDQPIDMRLVDGKVYMNMGDLSGNKFVMADTNDPNNPLGDMSSLTDSFDPLGSLDKFSDGVDKVVYVGDDTIDGDSVGQYELTIDTSKVSDALAGMGASSDASSGLPKALTYDAWVDSDNHLRKVTMDLGDLGTLEMSTSGWGDDVTIEAPPSDQITDSAALGG